MKNIIKRFPILTIALICGLSMTACTASQKSGGNVNETASTGTAQNQSAGEGNQSNAAETTEKQTDIFSTFKASSNYKTVIRPKLLKDGWQPARKDGEECATLKEICDDYPELGAGVSVDGFASFRWKKGDKIVNITGQVEETPEGFIYHYIGHEFEKPLKQTSGTQPTEPNVLGKYECCEDGVEGRYTLTLKANNAAVYKQVNEGANVDGTGSWSWDADKEFINVNLTVEWQFRDSEGEMKTETEKITFKLKRVGKDLKIVEETLSQRGSEGYYIGKTFKKL